MSSISRPSYPVVEHRLPSAPEFSPLLGWTMTRKRSVYCRLWWNAFSRSQKAFARKLLDCFYQGAVTGLHCAVLKSISRFSRICWPSGVRTSRKSHSALRTTWPRVWPDAQYLQFGCATLDGIREETYPWRLNSPSSPLEPSSKQTATARL